MVGWLKFYFLGFFNDKYGKEASTRSFLNVVLSLLLAFLLLCAGITAGYAASFGTHYKKATEFRSFLYSAFAEQSVPRLNLTFKNGKLDAEIDGSECVNTFKDGQSDGYRLIVDTRPAETTFDDFKLECKDANGAEISYEEYGQLPEQGRKNGSVKFVYTGNTLDVNARQSDYTAYLDKLSDETGSEYSAETALAFGELKNKKNLGEISAEEYANSLYALYAKAYYPDYSKVEIYGAAPTLRTYYMQAQLTESTDKYLILLDDLCTCAFITDGGIAVDFGSYYNGIGNTVIAAKGLSENEMRTNVDSFIAKCFNGSGGFNFLVHVLNIGKFVPVLILFMLVLGLILFILFKVLRLEEEGKLFGALKLSGGYLFYSALLTFFVQIICSFFCSRKTVFLISEIILVVAVLLRTVAFLIAEVIRAKKANRDAAVAEGE